MTTTREDRDARDTLDCPCCGDVGATADARNLFVDGQSLECGCNGHVSLDSETPAEIMIRDEGCDCATNKESES